MRRGTASAISPGAVRLDFLAMAAAGALDARLTLVRGSVAQAFNAAGNLAQIASGAPAFEWDPVTKLPLGLRIECGVTKTNSLLQCRDLTQAAWVKTGCTAALTQTGIGGVVNSASLLTATAPSATCLQSITAASSTVNSGPFIKRVTGTGAIALTIDGGTTWTDVTNQVGSSWSRPICAQQVIANPSFGIRLSVSGDAVAVDYAHVERGATAAFAGLTSPILTTTATVTRSADVLTSTLAALGIGGGSGLSIVAELMVMNGTPGGIFVILDDGTITNAVTLRAASAAARTPQAIVVNAGVSAGGFVANAPDQSYQTSQVFGVGLALSGLRALLGFNGLPPTRQDIGPSLPLSALTTVRLGAPTTGTSGALLGWLRSVTFYPYALRPGALMAASRPTITGANPPWQ